jgi:phenylpropionate dioxygenase-like ring-hydroxylating dioxygenase large terminal subunit
MLSKEDNELLCRVGPGTPVGELMRQYWLPAVMSSELPERDGRPMRLRILCEDLVAFRDAAGSVGILRQNCPHRGASLFFGRNEEEGLRCVYHGWKFDVSGRCVDMPNEPPESNFKDKVKATAYPTQERNGVVWVYMGPRESPPPLPMLEPNLVPDCRVHNSLRYCNWMQALEGDIDTSHLGFLHLGSVKAEDTKPGSFNYYLLRDRAPKYEVVDTDYGTLYGAYRPVDAETDYWRLAAFLFPIYTIIPTGVLGLKVSVRPWVPIDDEHTMVWSLSDPAAFSGAGGASAGGGAALQVPNPEFLPNTTDPLGRWRYVQRTENDYLLDFDAQRSSRSFTGIAGVNQQDQAITESMGPIMARWDEHLGTSDAMIIRTRQRIIRAARALAEHGTVPPGVDDPELYGVRGGGIFLSSKADWLDATADLRKGFVEHPELQSEAQAGRF